MVCVLDNNCYCQDLQFGLDGRFYRQPTPQNRQILFFKSLWDVKWQCHIGLTPSNQPSTTTTTDKKSNIDDDIKPMSEDDAENVGKLYFKWNVSNQFFFLNRSKKRFSCKFVITTIFGTYVVIALDAVNVFISILAKKLLVVN